LVLGVLALHQQGVWAGQALLQFLALFLVLVAVVLVRQGYNLEPVVVLVVVLVRLLLRPPRQVVEMELLTKVLLVVARLQLVVVKVVAVEVPAPLVRVAIFQRLMVVLVVPGSLRL
jgi:hypothetical protein